MKKTTQKGIFSIVAGWDRKEIESSEAMYQIFQLLFNDNEEEKDSKKAICAAATILIALWVSLILIALYVS